MAEKTLFLGIDVSTTGAKALLVDDGGKVVASAVTTYPMLTPKPLWSEQEPETWWQCAVVSIRKVLKQAEIENVSAIRAAGLTGQMHGLVLLDEAGRVLRPAILWNDQRTAAQCDDIRTRVGKERLIQKSGNDALTGFTAPKILWVQQNEPEIYRQVRHILLPKDYIRYRLTCEFAMDKSDGSGTILFDLKKRDWSPELLAALDIPPQWFPPTFEGPEYTGQVCNAAAEETGLPPGIPVVAGGGDQSCLAIGVGAVEPGIVALWVGTSGVVFATTPMALIEPEGRLHAFCHAVPDMWHFMGVMLSAAGSLQWFRDSIMPEITFDILLKEAETIAPGCEGLQFLPYLSGERTPYPDPHARGAFVGFTLRHWRGHMTRAVLEGVAFGLKDSFKLIQKAGLGRVRHVRVSGGGTRGSLWRKIMANVLETDLETVNTSEGASYGAALLAGVGVGNWRDVNEACAATIRVCDVLHPSPRIVETYREAYDVYHSLYPSLKPAYDRMAQD